MTALNDVAHVRLPDGRGYSLAVFIKNSWEDMEENERIMARVSARVYEVFREKALGNPLLFAR